jgi:hypothetical protein
MYSGYVESTFVKQTQDYGKKYIYIGTIPTPFLLSIKLTLFHKFLSGTKILLLS